jgi:WD40 repeat protein
MKFPFLSLLLSPSLLPTTAHGEDVSMAASIKLNGAVWGIAVAPDGKHLALAPWDGTLPVWDAAGKEELAKWDAHKHPAVHAVVYTPDGKSLLSCCEDSTVRQWDAASGKLVREIKGHVVGVKALDVARDGKTFLTAGSDGKVRQFDVGTGKLLRTMDYPEGRVGSPFRSVSYGTKDDFAVAGNAKGFVLLWDLRDGKPINLYQAHERGEITGIASRPGGKEFVTAADEDSVVKLWSVGDTKPVRTFEGHDGGVNRVAAAPNGSLIASGGKDKTVRLWDPATGKEKHKLVGHGAAVTGLTFADARTLVSGDETGNVIIWRLAR